MIQLILVRHATTIANQSGQFIGRKESEISKEGRVEIKKLKEKLEQFSIDGVYISPSKRVVQSIERFVKEQKIHLEQVEALQEINFGEFEGKTFNWIKTHYPEEIEKMIMEKDDYCYPKGESLIEAHFRIAKWLNEVLLKKEGNYLICAHGGTIRSILSELVVHSHSLHWHFKIENAKITLVNITDGFPVIEKLNE